MSLNAELPPPAKMPLWSGLSEQFAAELADYTPTGVLDAISAYEHEFGRARLIERLADMLHLDKARPGKAHREFCTLPFDIVCTTNFDFLLEKEYDRERQDNRTIHPVVDEDQLSINVGAAGTLLLKLHGDIRHPKRLLKPKGLTWKQVFAEANPNIETGTNYEKNFSRGKIAPQRAKQIAEWLERRFPETAAYVDELLTSVHYAIDSSSSWERFIEDHGQFSTSSFR